MIRYLVNIFLSVLPTSKFFSFRRLLLGWAKVEVSDGVKFCGRAWIYGRGSLSIGAHTWLSPGTKVFTHVEAAIYIGAQCDIGPNVAFITGGHAIGPPSRRAGVGTANAIKIGDGCWIGAHSVILGGVSIGPGSVIAAGSVVTKTIPANTLAAGVPARVKRQLL